MSDPRTPYFASALCLVLMVVVLTIDGPALSPTVLAAALIGTAVLLIGLSWPLHLLGVTRHRPLQRE